VGEGVGGADLSYSLGRVSLCSENGSGCSSCVWIAMCICGKMNERDCLMTKVIMAMSQPQCTPPWFVEDRGNAYVLYRDSGDLVV
jgi:hypothetical protein